MCRTGVTLASVTLALVSLAPGCVEHRASPTAGQVATIEVQLLDPPPNALGSPDAPVTVRQATFNVIARDENGAVIPRDLTANVFISFGGVKTGAAGSCGADDTGTRPIEVLTLTGGMLSNHTVDLSTSLAFGSTSIWIDEPSSAATGASPTIYFRNPLVPEVQTPPDLTAPNATFCSPFTGKFIIIDHASPGGQLVVSSVFGNAFAVTDTGASTFNSIYVYSFGKPPSDIVEGRLLKSFSGNLSKFVGFTELNFPLFDSDLDAPLVTPPAPVDIAPSDITTNIPKMLGAAASVIRFSGTICDPMPPNPTNDPNIQSTIDSWLKYNQFVLGNNMTCDSFNNMAVELPAKVLGSFDPLQHVGKQATFVGMLRNNSGQNPYLDGNGNPISCSSTMPCARGTCLEGTCYKNAFNFWTLQPRHESDITVAP
jgi:hypothetical protein